MPTPQNSLFAPTPFSVANGGTGNSTTLANGQTWIGNGTATPAVATLTAGNTNIQVTTGSGSISLSAAPVWTSSSSTLAPGVGIIGGTASYTLPTSSLTIGDTYVISNNAASGFVVHTGGNIINYSGTNYSSSLTTVTHYASIAIVYTGSGIFNTLWTSPGSVFTGA